MAIDILVTTDRINEDPLGREFISYLNDNSERLGMSGAALYYDFPTYSDYETVTYKPDALLVSPIHGVMAVRFVDGNSVARLSPEARVEVDEALGQFCSILIGRFLKSKSLRESRSSLCFNVLPVIFCPNTAAQALFDDVEAEVISSFQAFDELLNDSLIDKLDEHVLLEARSVLEGAKALTRNTKRTIEDPAVQRAAAALARLESEIANFDQKQRRAALVTVNGPQRIRGLAGSGKTVILAMKAAHLHMTRPDERILITFFTKSLRAPIKDLVTKFYRHYKEVDPDWNMIHIRHGWGGASSSGAYADACRRVGRTPRSYSSARDNMPRGDDPFNFACKELLSRGAVEPFYNHILIDEGQDFPQGFYELCYELAYGEADSKNIVWAYDELQNILNVTMRSPEELFGVSDSGAPKISLERAEGRLPVGATNDTVLSKCYRNQREILTVAHAMGFGIYSDIVQLLESPDHWRDVGYELDSVEFKVGDNVEILRPVENSPLSLTGEGLPPLIEYYCANGIDAEVTWVIDQVERFLAEGLQPEDLLIVAMDDRYMRSYFKLISVQLADRGISSNNIHADPYSEPPFTIAGKITMSTVYRAKGNEAAVVFVLGVDALAPKLRADRNKLFAAFTRTKAWLRISGQYGSTVKLTREIDAAVENFPYIRFTMPDLSAIELIQRDLSRRTETARRVRREYIKRLLDEGFSSDEINDILSSEGKDE